MQGILQPAAALGPRALTALTGLGAVQQGIAHRLLPFLPALAYALRLPSPCSSLASTIDSPSTSAAAAAAASWHCRRSLHTSTLTRSVDDAASVAQPRHTAAGPASILPAALSSSQHHQLAAHSPILLDGSRGADPGEPRYTAPYWVPEAVRTANQMPPVLFTDPWNPHDEPEIRRRHARLCYDLLLHSPRPLTVEEVHDAVNKRLRALHQPPPPPAAAPGGGSAAAAIAEAALAGAAQPPPPLLATTSYVKQLLEHMRRTRLLYGRKNPESVLHPGHPKHPRLYMALRYQAARYGDPAVLAQEDAVRREKREQRAVKRLRHGKPPYPIHRRRAYFSVWQHELAQEALRGNGPTGLELGLWPAAVDVGGGAAAIST